MFGYLVTHYPNSDISKCQVGVIGTRDGTGVDITFPNLKAGYPAIEITYGGRTYTNGDTLSVVLNRYSTLQLQSTGMVQYSCNCVLSEYISILNISCSYCF